jgi:Family of unknown function (DUF6346)
MSHQRREVANLQADPLAAPGRAEDGPVKDRAKALLAAVAAAALGLALLEGFTTLHSFYPGTRSGWFGPPERAAVAEVKTCRRLGPLSIDGVGYWWKCEVTVRVEDGRVVTTVVDRSIVTPADGGRTIEFREACKRGGLTDCSYGRPVGRGLKAALGALKLVEWTILAFFTFAIVLFLIRAVLGRQGYVALYDWLHRTQRPSPRH